MPYKALGARAQCLTSAKECDNLLRSVYTMYYKVRRVGETLGRSTDHIGARAQCLTRPWKRGPKVRWPFEPHRSESPMSKIC